VTMRVFVDTNVWVYAADRRDLAKQQQALAVVRSGAGGDVVVSAQVLGEFFDVTTRKLAERVATDDAQALVSEMAQLPVVPVDVRLVLAAIAGAAQWQLSYWDALIVAAAETSGCDVVLSEDLAHGRRYGSVRIENPFLSADERPESGG
jgi:predicted nucleic acid-binding protein